MMLGADGADVVDAVARTSAAFAALTPAGEMTALGAAAAETLPL